MFFFKQKEYYLILSSINAFIAMLFYSALIHYCFLFNLSFAIYNGIIGSLIGAIFLYIITKPKLKDKKVTLDMWRDIFFESFTTWVFPYFILVAVWNKIVKIKNKLT